MAQPASIPELIAAYGLTDITQIPAQQKIIHWQAYLAAFEADPDANPGVRPDARQLRAAALARMRMSECANKYLLDDAGQLIALNLYGKQLAEFSFAHDIDWRHLQVLVLSGNQLTALLLPAGLTQLRFLDMGDNPGLRSLAFDAALPHLETLDASDSGLERIAVPAGMTGLKTLDLSRNQLTEAVFEGDCAGLEWLDLSGNGLEEFRLAAGFGQLQYLYLMKNALTTLSFARPLRNLQTLHLSHNKLTALPNDLLSFSSLESLYLYKNEWTGNLASVIPSDENANAFVPVRDYLREFSKGTIQNDRVKIIIVGNGRTGKTSMFRRLKGLPFRADEAFTHGVDLGELGKDNLPEVKTTGLQANVWDFGGQHIFYATHQFFLTDGALYLLAWTAEKNVEPHRERDKDRLPFDEKWRSNEYWLENIRLHAPGSPIFMVQTHYDGVHEPYDQTAFAADPFRAECLEFAASNDHGLPALKKEISNCLNQAIPAFGEDFPETYDRVIGAVEKRKRVNKISRSAFNEICHTAGITPGGETSVLEFLRTVGAVVWFDRVDALHDTVFINPDWLTEQVYRLINNDLRARKGRFDQNYLAEKLPGLSSAERDQFLALLQNFELIFEAGREGAGVYISPLYLPERLDDDAQILLASKKRSLTLAFAFHFPKFVPENVMVNFLSRYGPYSDKIYWKNGISFTSRDDLDAIVEFDEGQHTLTVFANDDRKSHALQAEICRAFVELSRIANAEISLDGQVFVSWQELETAVQDGINKIKPKSGSSVPVSDFNRFFGKEPDGAANMSEARRPVIFFSYAWGVNKETGENREQIVDELYESLAEDGCYELQRDKKDNGYRKSIRDFMKQIGRGEFVVTVVSDKYLKSPNCMFELLEIFRKSNSEAEEFREKIFPVILGDAKIYDPLDRLDYVEFWMEKCQKLEEKIKKIGLANAKSAMPDFDTYDEIMKSVGLLGGILADLNTLSPQMLSGDNFVEIKKAIDERANQLMQKS